MISSGINLVMTVIGFAVSTMFIVFVCTRLICARIRLHASRQSFPISSRSDLSILERGLHGLEPLVVANFPTKKYGDIPSNSSEDTQCTVCLAEYQQEDMLRILPYCGHTFHAMCVDKWLQQHSTCPVCRISLRECPGKMRMQPMFSSALRACHHLSSNISLTSRAINDCRSEPILESHFASANNGVGVGGRVSILIEDRQTTKDSANKQVESPSNA
ncbi:hypothetical protein NMG60_11008865 [Bertholletia excelsa]